MAIIELQDFKLKDLFEKMVLDDEEFEAWLASMHLVPQTMPCRCGANMVLEKSAHGNKIWRCNRRVHQPQNQPGTKPKLGFLVGVCLGSLLVFSARFYF